MAHTEIRTDALLIIVIANCNGSSQGTGEQQSGRDNSGGEMHFSVEALLSLWETGDAEDLLELKERYTRSLSEML